MPQAVAQIKCSDVYVSIGILVLKRSYNKMQNTELLYAFDL